MQIMVKPPKKMLPLLILEVLRERSDSVHPLSQKDIKDALERDYELVADRKSIRRNIDNLLELGFPIAYSVTERTTVNQETGEVEDNSILTDLYLEHEFTESELRLLIDAILFSGHIPHAQRKGLIQKIAGLSSRYFKPHVSHVQGVPDALPQSPQLFLTIEMLDEAISAKKKVRFQYLKYGLDKQLHPRCKEDGSVREYVVSPYQMAAKGGKYYLICNNEQFDDLSNYRVDRIANIQILDESIRSIKELKDVAGPGLDLAKYMQEHIYMYQSDSSKVRFRIVRDMVSDVIDEFGTDVELSEEQDGFVCVEARVNEHAMFQFAKSFAPDVIILHPRRLAEAVAKEAQETCAAYHELLDIE